MSVLYYDLSEQFLASGLKFKYYGISRTVMEVGYELARSEADVRFVIFSPGHERFFEVTPRIGADSPTGILDPGLPPEATPIRMRYTFPKPNKLRDLLYPVALWGARMINLRRWRAVPDGLVREVDLNGQRLVSLGRPKIMADYLTVTARAGVSIKLNPLLHDMIPIYEFAHSSQTMFCNNFTHDNHIVIKGSEHVLSNSAFTKAEIERFSASGHLPQVPGVTVVPLSHELRTTDETVVQRGPAEPYVLCVGILTGRKNLECVMEALLHLHTTGRPVPPLVLAGAQRKRTDSYLEQDRFDPIRDRINIVTNPNQAELRNLYKGALALAIPSRMEGWGLPLGEALWLGTPGLASTEAAALKEVGGDLAQYFNPDAPEELAALIDRLQSDPDAYAALKARIAARKDELRSWKDVAYGVLDAVDALEQPREAGTALP
ncbi:glycosyltransferase [Sulfitobacter noctilucicola]|uniref:Glycosyltransferase involved in cell wall biosynthesis n=1 Tax=Sulfitobacter noctilucicola TaxID=1342301 RepID=A0A7W6MCW5_9RHOB|nr:glycosyltransferase [Sulfitobacter noctilucicola]MBB4176208.1 glycosyltransferase involved in cell wall biosynthesis [Sulfitobacter noctilucicola]